MSQRRQTKRFRISGAAGTTGNGALSDDGDSDDGKKRAEAQVERREEPGWYINENPRTPPIVTRRPD